MKTYYAEFITIAIVHFLAVASPGPDFALALKQSVTYGRLTGLWTSLGIGIGILVHVAYCILGLGIIISKSILLFNIIKYLGAFYLIYIGFKSLVSQPGKIEPGNRISSKTPSHIESFLTGFVTNALNPKATLFFLAVFSVTVSQNTPILIKVFYGLWMAFATTLWFGSLSMLFSREVIRNIFKKFGHWFERSMGVILVALGLRLALVRSN